MTWRCINCDCDTPSAYWPCVACGFAKNYLIAMLRDDSRWQFQHLKLLARVIMNAPQPSIWDSVTPDPPLRWWWDPADVKAHFAEHRR